MNTQEIQDWQIELNDLFPDPEKGKAFCDKEVVKSFIDQKLTEQREEIIKELEAILDYCKDDNGLIDKDLTVIHGVGGIVDLIKKYG